MRNHTHIEPTEAKIGAPAKDLSLRLRAHTAGRPRGSHGLELFDNGGAASREILRGSPPPPGYSRQPVRFLFSSLLKTSPGRSPITAIGTARTCR
jgi:hypothetical protein